MKSLQIKSLFIGDYSHHDENVVLAIRGCSQTAGKCIEIYKDEASQIINHLSKAFNLAAESHSIAWQVSPKANQQEINEANNLPLSDITKVKD